MYWRIAIIAHYTHDDPKGSRPVEVLEELDHIVTAAPEQTLRVQTYGGDVQFLATRRQLSMFHTVLREN